MASCQNIPKIGAYHDGELPPAEAELLEAHIRQCESCRLELERLRALSQWLTSSPAPAVSDEVLERLRRCVRPRRDRVLLRTAKALTAAAAAVLVVCSALLWQRWEAPAAPVEPAARWESAAVAPTSTQVTLSSGVGETNTETDVDVQIAKSILGVTSGESGNDDE
jgi:anti-sigma factor RsiW